MNSLSRISPNAVAIAFAAGAGLAVLSDHGWAGFLLAVAALLCLED